MRMARFRFARGFAVLRPGFRPQLKSGLFGP
jgi:hypothetical protein